jgi:hypothetical protein
MGARPSSFKKGGGFLNGVNATIVSYAFSDEFNGEPFKPGKIKDKSGKMIDKPHSLNCLLKVRVDDADDDTPTTLKVAGKFADWAVSEDGLTITPVDENGDPAEGRNLSANAAFSKFIASLVKPTDGGDGFPEERFPEEEFNFEAMIGTRVRLIQQTDVARTKEFGKKKSKSGQEFDRTDLVVETVFELPNAAGKSNGKAAKPAAKPAAVATKAAVKSAKPAKVEEPEVDVEQLAATTLVGILQENDGKIAKQKVGMKVLKALMEHDSREDVRNWLFDDDNLSSLAAGDGVEIDGETYGFTYNKAKGLIQLVTG